MWKREKENIKTEIYNRAFDGLNDTAPMGSCLNAWSSVGKTVYEGLMCNHVRGGMSLGGGFWG